MIDDMDKMAVLTKFAEVNDAGGIMILGVRKQRTDDKFLEENESGERSQVGRSSK